MDISNMRVLVDRIKCKGCGVCVAECPVGAMSQKQGFGVSRPELSAKIVGPLAEVRQTPKVIILCCDWSIYPGLRLSRTELTETESPASIIVTVCGGRIDPGLILDTFCRGAWGVMIACCPLGECEHDGNYRAKDRVTLVGKLLDVLGIGSQRLRIEHFATGEDQKLKKAVAGFVSEIKSLGSI